MPSPAVILVQPQMGENIGAAARVMYNFGLEELRIVAPRDGWPNDKADAMAAHALPIIQQAKIYDTTTEAIADFQQVFAVTARLRGMDKPVHTSRTVFDAMQQNQKSAWLFGPERSGLTNEDITLSDAIVTIPVNPECPSLNLAQAVGVLAYEYYQAVSGGAVINTMEATELAPKEQLIGMFEQLEQLLDEKGHYKTQEIKPAMVQNIRNLFQKAQLTEQEIRTLRGIFRTLGR